MSAVFTPCTGSFLPGSTTGSTGVSGKLSSLSSAGVVEVFVGWAAGWELEVSESGTDFSSLAVFSTGATGSGVDDSAACSWELLAGCSAFSAAELDAADSEDTSSL